MKLKLCPFCGTEPKRYISNEILHIECPNCVSVGFHNHVKFGCSADTEWNTRFKNNQFDEELELVKRLLEEAYEHLEYCSYGDSWERECAIDLRKALNDYFSD